MAQAPASLETTSALAADLECPVCLELFRDPLLLDCGHNICRACVAAVLRGGGAAAAPALCPECRAAVPDPASLKTNRALRNLADRARQLLLSEPGDRGGRVGPGPSPGSGSGPGSWADRCPRHGEELEFYCHTDRRLTCRACRAPGDHDGHAVRPLAEAAGVYKAELSDAVQFLLTDNQALRSLQEAQRAEIAGIQEKSRSLAEGLAAQFGELHAFLRRREDELAGELARAERAALAPMGSGLARIEAALREGTAAESQLLPGLDLAAPQDFLQWWGERGTAAVDSLKERDPPTQEAEEWEVITVSGYESRLKSVSVTPGSLSLGPYETHLQYFIWREMQQVLRTVPDRLTLVDAGDPSLVVGADACSVRRADAPGRQRGGPPPDPPAAAVRSRETFSSGAHYWEVEVGQKTDWSVGVQLEKVQEKQTRWIEKLANFLWPHSLVVLELREGSGYRVSAGAGGGPVRPAGRPRRVGVYLDCGARRVTFYSADDMSPLHTQEHCPSPSIAAHLCPGPARGGRNRDPLTLCRY